MPLKNHCRYFNHPPCPVCDACHSATLTLEGELPLNTFGGSLSEGRLHGMGHTAEAVIQVTDRADKRQVPNASAVCAIDGSPMLRGSGLVITREP